ncbi:MAG TPA: hypothetical protein VFG05_13485 [Methylocella sp.]|nr:hypothetical protein [Methylocella sp.]
MALSGKAKRGIFLAVAVIAGLASTLLSVLLLLVAAFFIIWGLDTQRTEAFVGGLPYGNAVLKALAKLDSLISD